MNTNDDMKEQLIIAVLGSVAKVGLEATAIVLERMSQPGATLGDAAKACREASLKTLAQFKAEAV
jgi:hypothetical protein